MAARLIDPPPALAPATVRIELADPVFISDLHLSADHPRTLDAFLRFARDVAPNHGELVILGDLFEYWAGDDDLADSVAQVASGALIGLARSGRRVFVMRGNRDLLIGPEFVRHVGATLLADPALAAIGDQRVLLAHGDAYCTRDEPYQRFRAQTHDPDFQRGFLARPLTERKAFIGQARSQSESAKRMKAADIMDVTPDAIGAALRAAGVTLMIHGHTHRPARHDFVLDYTPAQRFVLSDWDYDATPVRGGYIRFAGGAPVAEDF